ncbi:MAG: family 16 glycoside hydrolase [Candidatus Binatia bacterium]
MANSRWFPILLLLIGIALPQTAAEAASISLSWADMSTNEDGFRVERKASGGSYAQIATVGANVKSYTDSGVTSGVSYCYVVKAFNSSGVSAPSNSACTTPVASTGSGSSGTGSGGNSGGGAGASGGGSTGTPAYTGGKWKDYSINLSMKSLDNDAIGVIFRYLDDGNYYRFIWNRSGGYRRIEKRENGVLSVLAEKRSQYQRQQEYRIQIKVRGSRIEVWINGGAPVFSLTDDAFDHGTIGLYSSSNKGSIFDDVVVTDLLSGQTLLSDNFNDGDYTGWTMLDEAGTTNAPSAWAVSSGALVQTSNIGSTDNDIGTFALYTRGSWTDYTASLNLTSGDNDSIGVMFRYNDNDNYYRFSWNAQSSRRRLEKIRNGGATVLAEDSQAYAAGRTYGLKISAKGTSLQVHIDGQLIFSVTDSTFAGGTIALYSSHNTGSAFDNVLVEDLNTGSVLLWDDFNDGNPRGWTIIDEGDVDGPSQWLVSNGTLVQNSNVGSSAGYGTFALY